MKAGHQIKTRPELKDLGIKVAKSGAKKGKTAPEKRVIRDLDAGEHKRFENEEGDPTTKRGDRPKIWPGRP